MEKNTIFKAFNSHLFEFIDDMQTVFPDNDDIECTKTALVSFKKANPKLLIQVWHEYVGDQYRREIEDGNLVFFINKDYKKDIHELDEHPSVYQSGPILEAIDRIRNPLKEMGEDNQGKSIKYIQNLTKLANLYNKN